ncbi:MAG TPA: GNAT family N-acetyltransferase [Pyrinomonadaceae bacterium]|jgi:ribosomal protein S18 acetylase RimI-like enzyme|nr:GNAT family N-acetyltransferase [Pyrinomonadaceae bacterium]
MNNDILIKPLSNASLADAVSVWNRGFQGYFIDMTLSIDDYLTRLHNESISPELSFIAYLDQTPAGFLLNGVRINAGKKLAWNGGTGVAPEYRGQGLGKLLVDAALKLYQQQHIEVATLEALSDNKSAIKLYQSAGYQIDDRLVFLEHDGDLTNGLPQTRTGYAISAAAPAEVGRLDFYQPSVPWQAQWQSLMRNNGSALIVVDDAGGPVGYALYRKRLDEEGRLLGIALHQCAALPGHKEAESIAVAALRHAFAPVDKPCRRLTHNLSKTNELVCGILKNAGFHTYVEQVHMTNCVPHPGLPKGEGINCVPHPDPLSQREREFRERAYGKYNHQITQGPDRHSFG